jgi:hypothetical protein
MHLWPSRISAPNSWQHGQTGSPCRYSSMSPYGAYVHTCVLDPPMYFSIVLCVHSLLIEVLIAGTIDGTGTRRRIGSWSTRSMSWTGSTGRSPWSSRKRRTTSTTLTCTSNGCIGVRAHISRAPTKTTQLMRTTTRMKSPMHMTMRQGWTHSFKEPRYRDMW